MLLTQDSTVALSAKLNSNVITSQVIISTCYANSPISFPVDTVITTNNTTAVTLLAAPASPKVNLVKNIKIYNADTATATIFILLGSNVIFKQTLSSGQSIVLSEFIGLPVSTSGFLMNINNLSDVSSTSTSRNNLGLTYNSTNATIQMDGIASAGTSGEVCDASHVHPSDTSRATLAGLSTQVFSAANGTTGNQVVNFSQFVTSLVSNGYLKLPGGVIIQWGIVSPSAAVGQTEVQTNITFPISFPTAFLQVYTNFYCSTSLSYWSQVGHRTWNATTSGFSINEYSNSGTCATGRQYTWLAIGY